MRQRDIEIRNETCRQQNTSHRDTGIETGIGIHIVGETGRKKNRKTGRELPRDTDKEK